MAKNKPRWERVSAYELAKKKALGEATEAEIKAAEQAKELRLAGVRPVVYIANGNLVVR